MSVSSLLAFGSKTTPNFNPLVLDGRKTSNWDYPLPFHWLKFQWYLSEWATGRILHELKTSENLLKHMQHSVIIKFYHLRNATAGRIADTNATILMEPWYSRHSTGEGGRGPGGWRNIFALSKRRGGGVRWSYSTIRCTTCNFRRIQR